MPNIHNTMDALRIITSVLTLISGVGIFLIACSMMSSGLETLGGGKLKTLLSKASKSKLAGVGIGAAATAVIQSSSATSVTVIGFVNAGIMTLAQAATVIFGANIGTTVTGQLVAVGLLGDSAISASVIFGAFAGIGAFISTLAKRDKTKYIGGVISGFGMLFVGLSMMSGAMSHFSELNAVKIFLSTFENPLLSVLIGAVLTAVIQSSSAMTTMTITMVVSGLVSLNQGIYLTMGANIGTCATALLAGFGGTKNAKRAALIHLIFNVSGVAVFVILGAMLRIWQIDYGRLFAMIPPNAPQLQLAAFHTVFNVTTALIVLPFTNTLVRLVTAIIPENANSSRKPRSSRRIRSRISRRANPE